MSLESQEQEHADREARLSRYLPTDRCAACGQPTREGLCVTPVCDLRTFKREIREAYEAIVIVHEADEITIGDTVRDHLECSAHRVIAYPDHILIIRRKGSGHVLDVADIKAIHRALEGLAILGVYPGRALIGGPLNEWRAERYAEELDYPSEAEGA